MELTSGWEMLTRPQMHEMLAHYGYRLALRKALPGRECSCLAVDTKAPDKECTKCLSTGQMFVDYLVLGRKYTPRYFGTPNDRHPIGIIADQITSFIIEAWTRPNTGDIILELVLDPETTEPVRPYKIRVAYKITNVDEMRDIRGVPPFYQLRCEEKVWGTI